MSTRCVNHAKVYLIIKCQQVQLGFGIWIALLMKFDDETYMVHETSKFKCVPSNWQVDLWSF
jgi:hypothetical protein